MRITVLYVRVSSREQAMNGYSADGQIRQGKIYAEKMGYVLDTEHIFIDRGKSGLKESRPDFDRMMKLVRSGVVERIIVKKSDRLSRIIEQREKLLQYCYKHKIQIDGMDEVIRWETADDRRNARNKAVNDQAESELISERTRFGIDESALQGNYAKGSIRPPLGYDKVDKKLVLNHDEVPIVRDVFGFFLNNNGMLKQTLEYSKAKYKGIRNWNEKQLMSMLKNKIYAGIFDNGRVVIENHSPAIISSEMYMNIERLIKMKSTKKYNRYVYSGLVACLECNVNCYGETHERVDKKYVYYVCQKCGKRINQTKIDEYFNNHVIKLLDKRIIDKGAKKIVEKLERMDQEEKILFECFEEGFISESYFRKNIKTVYTTKNSLVAELGTLNGLEPTFYLTLSITKKRKLLLNSIQGIIINYNSKVVDYVIDKLDN